MSPVPALPVWSRRGFLAVSTAGALGLAAGPAHAVPGPAAPADEFTALRRRWCELTLGTGFDPSAPPYAAALQETGALASTFQARMRPTAGSLWPDCRYDPPSGITQSYSRLHTMAQAYAQPGTGRTGDPDLAQALVTGLGHLEATVYRTATTRYGNWWEWQIGSPRLLLDTLAILDERLPDGSGVPGDLRTRCLAAVDHFVPDTMLGDYTGTSTGANRVDLCRVVALRGVLGRAPDKIALARDALSPVFPYVTAGDGLYADGSFVQHTWVAYSGTYGYVLLDGLGRLFALLGGSSWQLTDPARQIIFDSVERAYAPLLHNGLMMDCVNGRAISRGYLRSDERHILRSDHYHGHALIAAVALLARSASSAERDRWHAMIKGWIARDRTLPVLTDRQYPVADLARLGAIARSPSAPAPEPVGHRLFPAMDRAVHRRPGWAAGLAMASDRIAYYENGNGENPRGWHTGAGMLSWWGADFGGDQYTDAFWPTVDPYRLPGTTVSTKRLADNEGGGWGEPKPAARWVGGTTDGTYAALGQDLRGLASTLTARKSWFALADCLVCLGAGITARDGVPAETVVDNRCLGSPAPRRSPSTASRSPAPSAGPRPSAAPTGPTSPATAATSSPAAPPHGAARGPHRLLARHQHDLLHRALHPPLSHPLARPRHRSHRRLLRLPPDAGRHPRHARRPRRRPALADRARQRRGPAGDRRRPARRNRRQFLAGGPRGAALRRRPGERAGTGAAARAAGGPRRHRAAVRRRPRAHRRHPGDHLVTAGARGARPRPGDRGADHRAGPAAARDPRHELCHPPLHRAAGLTGIRPAGPAGHHNTAPRLFVGPIQTPDEPATRTDAGTRGAYSTVLYCLPTKSHATLYETDIGAGRLAHVPSIHDHCRRCARRRQRRPRARRRTARHP